jgi:hypothetical protein
LGPPWPEHSTACPARPDWQSLFLKTSLLLHAYIATVAPWREFSFKFECNGMLQIDVRASKPATRSDRLSWNDFRQPRSSVDPPTLQLGTEAAAVHETGPQHEVCAGHGWCGQWVRKGSHGEQHRRAAEE